MTISGAVATCCYVYWFVVLSVLYWTLRISDILFLDIYLPESLFVAMALGSASFTASRCVQRFSISRKMSSSTVNAIKSHDSIVNGVKLHWETAGSGPHNILLLPGALGSTRTDFQPQLTKLDGSLFTIYAWDPPGYGKSRPPDRTWPDKFFSRDAAAAASLIKHIGEMLLWFLF